MWFNCSLRTKSHRIRQQARPECSGYSTDDNKNHNDKSKEEVGIS